MNKTTYTTRKTLKIFGITIFEWFSDILSFGVRQRRLIEQDVITSKDYMILEEYKAKAKMINDTPKDDNSPWWKKQ